MAALGAQPGNQNAKKAKRWSDAIARALAKVELGKGVEAGLDTCATQLVKAAIAGEQWALKELGDRIDGKAAQSVTVSGDEDNPLRTVSKIELVDLSTNSATPKA